MYNGLLGEDDNFTGASDNQHDLLVGMNLECSVSEDNLAKLMKGDITDSIAHGICIECNKKIGSQKSM